VLSDKTSPHFIWRNASAIKKLKVGNLISQVLATPIMHRFQTMSHYRYL